METTAVPVVSERQLSVMTEEENNDGPMEDTPVNVVVERQDFLPAACTLLEELVEQLAYKDSPPTNDMEANGSTTNSTTTTSLALVPSGGRPLSPLPRNTPWKGTVHSRPALRGSISSNNSDAGSTNSQTTSPHELPGTPSFETSESSQEVQTYFQDLLKEASRALSGFPKGHPIAEYNKALDEQLSLPDRLGHTTLAALSNWTITVLGMERKQATVPPVPMETSMVPFSPSSRKGLPPISNKNSTRNKARRWRKQRQSPTNATRNRPSSPTFRLQMYGSEYARHLSSSALAPTATLRSTTRRSSLRKSSRKYKCSSLSTVTEQHSIYLDDADMAYQTGALLEIVVSTGDSRPPPGYYRLGSSQNPLALERGKTTLFLDVKKEPSWDKAVQRPCITSVTIVFPDRYEFVPPGFSIVRDGKSPRSDKSIQSSEVQEKLGAPADIGLSERAFLCFRRSREGNPVTSVMFLSPSAAECVPSGYTVVERSPRNYVASIPKKPGQVIFLAYQQRLANLETLRPVPLIMSVLVGQSNEMPKEGDEETIVPLEAFYATSGTIVASEVGRFHIMDRSTHALLSPSSISNRLLLIEQSRITAGKKSLGLTESTDLMSTLSRTISTSSSRFESGDSRYLHDSMSETEHSQPSLFGISGERGPVGAASIFRNTPASVGRPHIFMLSEKDQRACHSALSFIPEVETVSGTRSSMNKLQARCLLITPILTCCYNRHGGSALVAVEGLHHLLTKTDFFEDDVNLSDDGEDESCRRLTLLDLTLQVVCDVVTCGAQETTFAACVEFVEAAVRFSQAQLHTRTVGYVIRFYLFIFYFGATIPVPNNGRPSHKWGTPQSSNGDTFSDNESILYDPRENGALNYLPGGAPQSAALAIKEIISLCLVRLGKVSVGDIVLSAVRDVTFNMDNHGTNPDTGSLVGDILSATVDDAVAHVDRANLAQLALHQIHRSGGSELFWHDMVNACGAGLFGRDEKISDTARDIYAVTFALLATLTKIAFAKTRSSANQELLPREISSKCLSLELLLHFLENWTDQQEAVSQMCGPRKSFDHKHSTETLAYMVRRMVSPCLLSNTKMALENSTVFCRVIRIVFELWKSEIYRRHCKAELGILMEQYVIRLLNLGPQLLESKVKDLWSSNAGQSLHFQQLTLLRELKIVFLLEPKQALELYLNFDTDFVSEESGTVQLLQGSQWKLFQKLSSALSLIAEQCGGVICRQIEEHRTMIDSREDLSAEQLRQSPRGDKTAIRESARSLRTASLEALSQMVRAVALSAGASVSPKYTGLFASWSSVNDPVISEDTVLDDCTELALVVEETSLTLPDTSVSNADPQPSKDEAIATAVEIASRKTLKKAIEYLIACNILPPSPRDIATFLRVQSHLFDPTDLGHYLGEGGVGGSETEYWNAIRVAFIRPISFVGMSVDQGLRHFLTQSGFVLPGEAQKIDRIINTFAQCYYEDNAGDVRICPFRNEDTVYMLCFAIIMLNTDLHKISAVPGKGRRMSKSDFIQNLRGVEQGEDIPRPYLSDIYDSIEMNPISLEDSSDRSTANEDRHAIVQEMLNSVRASISLLQSLSVHDFRFTTVKDVANARSHSHHTALKQVAREAISKTWHHWHSVISTCLETAHLDLQGMEPCVDILLYALATTVCLDMEMEKAAFLTQLGRLKAFEELRQGKWVHAPSNDAFQTEDWYVELEEACNGSDDRRIWALRNIREWMESVQGAVLEDVYSQAELARAVAELENGESLLQDPARAFVRSGSLLKKSGRTGRSVEYRFFLFSDILVYAKSEGTDKLKIHEELPLYQMKVVDWYPSTQKGRQRAFDIHHPRKKFTVLCPDADERKSWVEDIRRAIAIDVERKMNFEAARLAVLSETM